MIESVEMVAVAALGAGAVIGGLLGLAYFVSMKWTVERHIAGTYAWRTVAATGVRFAVAVAVFAGLSQWDAMALIGALAGFAVTRHWVLSRVQDV